MADRGTPGPEAGMEPEDASAWADTVIEVWRAVGEPHGTTWAEEIRVPRVCTAERRRLLALLKAKSEERLSNRAIAVVLGLSHTQANKDWRAVKRDADRVTALLREAENAVRGAVDDAAVRQAAPAASARVGIARKRVSALMKDLQVLDVLLRESLS